MPWGRAGGLQGIRLPVWCIQLSCFRSLRTPNCAFHLPTCSRNPAGHAGVFCFVDNPSYVDCGVQDCSDSIHIAPRHVAEECNVPECGLQEVTIEEQHRPPEQVSHVPNVWAQCGILSESARG